MVATRLSSPVAVPAFPIFWDASTAKAFDLTSRDLLGWRDFKVARADSTTVTWIISPVIERKEQRSFGRATDTGPSETTVLPTAMDATRDSGDSMAALEIAAEAGEEAAFVQVTREIDWLQRPAVDFARAVRLALAAGAHVLARKLATHGAKLYPDHLELQKMAHILAPPRVVETDTPATASLSANQAWLRAHADQYKGQWVALRDGSLLAVASSAAELKAHLESTGGIMLTRVF